MACSECGSQTIAFAVPADYRVYVSSSGSSAADTASSESDADATDQTELVAEFCPRCLTLEVSDEPQPRSESTTADDEIPAFSRVSDAFPIHRERAIPLALALGLSSSLATNRSAIETLLRDVERAGTDPLLVLDRLQRDPAVEPAIDLERRQHQLEQLLYS